MNRLERLLYAKISQWARYEAERESCTRNIDRLIGEVQRIRRRLDQREKRSAEVADIRRGTGCVGSGLAR